MLLFPPSNILGSLSRLLTPNPSLARPRAFRPQGSPPNDMATTSLPQRVITIGTGLAGLTFAEILKDSVPPRHLPRLRAGEQRLLSRPGAPHAYLPRRCLGPAPHPLRPAVGGVQGRMRRCCARWPEDRRPHRRGRRAAIWGDEREPQRRPDVRGEQDLQSRPGRAPEHRVPPPSLEFRSSAVEPQVSGRPSS